MNEESRWLALAVTCVFALIFTLFSVRISPAHDPAHHEEDEWFESLRQPDAPTVSCCGEADHYWADSYEVTKDGEYVAIITDERDDKQFGPNGRVHVDVGTKIVIPKYKLKWDQGNVTGHGIVFMNAQQHVFCYLPPGGV